jgi:hypothetical protein
VPNTAAAAAGTDQSEPVRAQRGAHGHFLLPGAGSGQEQVGHVGACNQKEETDGAEEDPQIVADAARKRLLEGEQADTPVLRKLRRLSPLQVGDDGTQVRLRLRLGDARLEPAQQMYTTDALDDCASREHDRQIDVRPPPHEPLRHHADYGADLPVQCQLPPDDARIAAELALPEAITEHHDRRRVRPAILRRVRSAHERRYAHDLERVWGSIVPAQPLRVAISGPEDVADRGRDHAVENRAPLRNLEELIGRIAGSEAALVGAPDADAHQAVDVLVGKRVEHHGVEDAVDRRGGHDPEGKRQQRHGREPGTLGKRAKREPDVPHNGLEPVGSCASKAIRVIMSTDSDGILDDFQEPFA